ncbi:MAG: cytidine deaminase [Cryobacterium sp.]|nr:cytidine deaminase [Oligoflexia bacterium]
MKTSRLPARLKPLYALAKKARKNSHSPYSGCKVGAAILLTNGKVFSGCNVENSSYGATVCAERGAIQTAVAAEGKIKIAQIVVVTDSSPPWLPCALCRQVISEFAAKSPGGDIPVHCTNLEGDAISTTFLALYPGLFSPEELRAGQSRA